jgi:hypothetical protein
MAVIELVYTVTWKETGKTIQVQASRQRLMDLLWTYAFPERITVDYSYEYWR